MIKKINKKSQIMLETTLIFIIFCLFIFGIMHIWSWNDTQLVQRQISYNNSRVDAGSVADSADKPLYWTIYSPTQFNDEGIYSDEEVFN